MQSEWLSLSEAADALGVHPSTVRSWADQGRLPVHRTQGGHRRFRRNEVELCREIQLADGQDSLDLVIQSALKRTRVQISEGHLENEAWYHKLDEDARQQYRQSGRYLLQGIISSLISDIDEGLAEARGLGYEYASRGKRCGLNCAEATRAFLFFRNQLFESMYSVYENAAISSPHAWAQTFRKINAFTDQILVNILETYEAYQRNNR